MIRHEVHHVSQAERREPIDEPRVCRRPAELGVDRVVIADIVPVRAAGVGCEVGRRVACAGTELCEIRRQVRSGIECEAGVELKAVGAEGDVHVRLPEPEEAEKAAERDANPLRAIVQLAVELAQRAIHHEELQQPVAAAGVPWQHR